MSGARAQASGTRSRSVRARNWRPRRAGVLARTRARCVFGCGVRDPADRGLGGTYRPGRFPAQIRNIKAAYGMPITAWVELVNASRPSKHADIVAMLKTGHGWLQVAFRDAG